MLSAENWKLECYVQFCIQYGQYVPKYVKAWVIKMIIYYLLFIITVYLAEWGEGWW